MTTRIALVLVSLVLVLSALACGGGVSAPEPPPCDAGALDASAPPSSDAASSCPAPGVDVHECSYAAAVCASVFGPSYRCGVVAGDDPYVARADGDGGCAQDYGAVGPTCAQLDVGDAGLTLTCCTLR